MSSDLDWTAALGEAVVADQGAVLEAVQAFRRKTQAAGNLKTDEKQTVVVEKEVITIVPTDPQVIYVPQYNPTTVVVYSGYAGCGYYPCALPGVLLPVCAGRRVRHRPDLGRGDRRGLGRRPLRLPTTAAATTTSRSTATPTSTPATSTAAIAPATGHRSRRRQRSGSPASSRDR